MTFIVGNGKLIKFNINRILIRSLQKQYNQNIINLIYVYKRYRAIYRLDIYARTEWLWWLTLNTPNFREFHRLIN